MPNKKQVLAPTLASRVSRQLVKEIEFKFQKVDNKVVRWEVVQLLICSATHTPRKSRNLIKNGFSSMLVLISSNIYDEGGKELGLGFVPHFKLDIEKRPIFIMWS